MEDTEKKVLILHLDDNDRKGGDVDDGDDLRPNCIFSVCACPIGFIFDGNRNCQRDMSYAGLLPHVFFL